MLRGVEKPKENESSDVGPLTVLAAAALVAVCCASVPLLLAVLSGVAVGVLLGAGAGILAAVAVTGFVVSAVRRRRSQRPGPSGAGGG